MKINKLCTQSSKVNENCIEVKLKIIIINENWFWKFGNYFLYAKRPIQVLGSQFHAASDYFYNNQFQ